LNDKLGAAEVFGAKNTPEALKTRNSAGANYN
jgi:hypothetical protein